MGWFEAVLPLRPVNKQRLEVKIMTTFERRIVATTTTIYICACRVTELAALLNVYTLVNTSAKYTYNRTTYSTTRAVVTRNTIILFECYIAKNLHQHRQAKRNRLTRLKVITTTDGSRGRGGQLDLPASRQRILHGLMGIGQ